jgi:hypothetical protein
MSGGSMDYLYSKVEEAEFHEDTPIRRAFRKHLNKVAKALRAIEWNDSCDGDDREEEYIKACFSDSLTGAVAKDLTRELEQALKVLKKSRGKGDGK